MADIEKEVLDKTKGNSFENVGDSTNEKGNELNKKNLTKEEQKFLALNRGDGMQDIVYDNKPSEKFEKRMEKDMGEDVYNIRQEKMDYKSKAPMYNKDTQPTDDGIEKKQYNKFEKGYNMESVTGKYKDEFNKIKIVEFKLSDVNIINKLEENYIKINLDGIGNGYSIKNKQMNENVDFKKIVNEYNFYINENKIFAIKKMISEANNKVNESLNKMKHLMNYKPNDYVDTKKSVKF
jgi:hypothetical protein